MSSYYVSLWCNSLSKYVLVHCYRSYNYPPQVYLEFQMLVDDLKYTFNEFQKMGNRHGERNRATAQYRAWDAATIAFDKFINTCFVAVYAIHVQQAVVQPRLRRKCRFNLFFGIIPQSMDGTIIDITRRKYSGRFHPSEHTVLLRYAG